MLYDNAQLLHLLASAWAATGELLFRERAAETVAWLGGRCWRTAPSPPRSTPTARARRAGSTSGRPTRSTRCWAPTLRPSALAYGVTASGNWEGNDVLNRLHEPGLPGPAEAERCAAAGELLLEARERRVRPGRDDKVLADWNGLMISALAKAAGRLASAAGWTLRRAPFAGVLSHPRRRRPPAHSGREGRRLPTAFLDDYAQMSLAAVTLFEHTGDAGTSTMPAPGSPVPCRLRDPDLAPPPEPAAAGLIVRPLSAQDGPYPLATAPCPGRGRALVPHRRRRHRRRADAILAAFAGEARRNPFAHATLLAGVAYPRACGPDRGRRRTGGPGRDRAPGPARPRPRPTASSTPRHPRRAAARPPRAREAASPAGPRPTSAWARSARHRSPTPTPCANGCSAARRRCDALTRR